MTATASPPVTDPHAVLNQPPPLAGFDPLACDPALTGALRGYGPAGMAGLAAVAAVAGSAEAREHAHLANANPPVLHTHDRYGHRVDEVSFHPSWHWLVGKAVGFGLHAAPWVPGAGPGAHLARAAGFYLMAQVESGHGCPISMTYACVPALRAAPSLAE